MRKYAIVCGSRSGSTYLCNLLNNTKRCGQPQEFFNHDMVPYFLKHLSLEQGCGYSLYKDRLIKKFSTENQVFGIKIVGLKQWREVCRSKMNFTHWIHLSRKDQILQAISRYRAFKTNGWHRNTNPPEYSFEGIKWCLEEIKDENFRFDNILHEKNKLEISYEDDLCVAPEQTVISILEFMNITVEELPYIKSFKKETDEINLVWKEKFLMELNEKT